MKVIAEAEVYQHFDCDLTREVPAEAMGSWQKVSVDLDLEKTAVVSMHAWENPPPKDYPGCYRCGEYLPRATKILETVFPPLFADIRKAGLPLFHMVEPVLYGKALKAGKTYAPPADPAGEEAWTAKDPYYLSMQELRMKTSFVGKHNRADVERSFPIVDFHASSRPQGKEPVIRDTSQLEALCKEKKIVHLIYVGFAINVCLFHMPGGIWSMAPRGYVCSAIREATTAVENKESARHELHKEAALWQVGLETGFVFREAAFRKAIRG